MGLKELRTARNMLQRDVAALLDVDRTTYAKYESGLSEPNHETLIKLSNIFDVSIDVLLGNERKKEPPATVSGDEELTDPREDQLIACVRRLTPDQQDLLLAQMKLMQKRE